MTEDLYSIQSEALESINSASCLPGLEEQKVAFIGKKGKLTAAQGLMKTIPNEEKKAFGQKLNEVRSSINTAIEEKRNTLQEVADAESVKGIDLTLPSYPTAQGGLHPITIVKDEAIQILRRLGFALAEGPEIETEFHCFDALNTPEDHPARNEKDTFYFDSGKLLRTHTSSVQVRTMESEKPPIRIIAPGSAYRRDEIDATHLSVFNQLEGLYVDKDVSLNDLKGTLEYFYQCLFGKETELRFRPHFFPFTEPSFEIDIMLHVEGQKPKWVEVAGCGIVDPAIFESVFTSRGDDAFSPEKVTGFAFGMGIDRLAMIKYGVPDIRLLIENDARFLSQFA